MLAVADDDGPLERVHELALEPRARLGAGQPADVDAADRDALRDLVAVGLVVRVDHPGERADEDEHEDDDEEDRARAHEGGASLLTGAAPV